MANLFQSFAANALGRDFVVGDVHGCFYQLDTLLGRIGFDRDRDRLFCVGDLIDRGPDSERAADFIDACWFHAVRGNHEQMMLDAVTEGGNAKSLWQMNGGDWFASLDDAQRERLVQRAASLPYGIEVALDADACAGLVHAQMPAMSWPELKDALRGESIDTTLAQALLWERDSANEIERRRRGARPGAAVSVAGVDVIFHGHTPMPRPTACANTRWLDTGAFMDGPLSIAELAVDGRVWSLHAATGRLDEEWQSLANDGSNG